MKKRRLKKWVRLTINFMVIFIIALCFTLIANARANQVDRSMGYETNCSINN
jgi:hypothetical protein